MTDRWESTAIKCTGGLVLNVDALTQGSVMPGSARVLQNFEPAIDGGYRRISGFEEFDNLAVPGDVDSPILGVGVALGGVFAVRYDTATTDNAIYFSSGSGWSLAPLNTTPRTGDVTKARFITYSITEPVVIETDGFNTAWKWDGTTDTDISGTGAPADPKYAALLRTRLVLAGYTANESAISISAPDDDTDFDGTNGAIEINVGDRITGIKTFRDTLYIFCEKTIKKLIGSSDEDFAIRDVSLNIGCLSHDTIQEIGGDLIFLASDGIRSVAATERIDDIELGLVSANIQPFISPILGDAFENDEFSSCVVSKKSQYRLFINDNSSTEEDNINFMGKLEGRDGGLQYAWATLVGFKPYCAYSGYTNNQEYAVFGHTTSGFVYRMEQGSTFYSKPIFAIYRTPDITFISDKSDATIRKVFQKLSLYSQVEGDVDFKVNLKLDREGLDVLQPEPITFDQQGSSAIYGTAVYDTDSYGNITYPVFYANLIGSGFTGAFLFTSDMESASFRIDSFQIQLSTKGRR